MIPGPSQEDRTTTILEAAAQSARAPEPQTGARLISLDAYRGLIMLLLVSHGFGFAALAGYPAWEWLARQVDHAAWQGVTFWDLIQPAFTFMVGVAMPFAFARRVERGARFWDLFRHVTWRAFMLVAISNFLSNFGSSGPKPVLQFVNVLSQIAFGYLICFLITRLRFRYQVAAALVLLGGYWSVFVAFPGPEGPFSKAGNIGAIIDMAILGYNYRGFYTTINFIGNAVTILFGCWAGMLLMQPYAHAYKLKVLAAAAAASFAEGLALEPLNPMVKRLWTASFTFYSAGWVILMLIAIYWLIEVRGKRKWAFPFVVMGMNSIFIYCFSYLLHGWLYQGLGIFTGNFGFLGKLGSIPQNLLVLGVMWYLCYWLYRRQIFLKI